MRMRRLILYLILIVILIYISIYDMVRYEFTEQFTAAQIAFSKLLIPIILITIASSIVIIRYGYQKGRLLKSKIIDYFKAAVLFIISIGGIGLITFAVFQGSLLITNRTFGQQKDVLVNGTIAKYNEINNRGKVHYYIGVNDPNFNRIISLRVNHTYKVGDSFTMSMKMGCLDLLYKK